MTQFRPFPALRYSAADSPATYTDVAAPPYDVLSDADRLALEQLDTRNSVRLDFPHGATDPDAYAGARRTLEAWMAEGIVAADKTPTFTVYRMTAVVVGWHRDFSFERLTAAFTCIRSGARLIGTNDDATYPIPGGELPGGGSIVAAVAYASGAVPVFGGKPHAPSARLVFERLGWGSDPSEEQRSSIVMVGDRPSTDGGMARMLGGRFALVLSGVTGADELPTDPAPDVVAPDLATLVAREIPEWVHF